MKGMKHMPKSHFGPTVAKQNLVPPFVLPYLSASGVSLPVFLICAWLLRLIHQFIYI